MVSLRGLSVLGTEVALVTPVVECLGGRFCPLDSWQGWAALFSLLHRRMEGAGVDPGGLGAEKVGDKMCRQWCLLVDVEQLEAHLAKTQGGANGFHFCLKMTKKMLELGVSWVVFFPSSSLSCILLLLLPLFPEEKRYKRERGNFTPFAK